MPRPPMGPPPGGRPSRPPMDRDIDLEALAKETEEMLELKFLSKENAVFTERAGGFVSLKVGEQEFERVNFYRAFPFTDPDRYISVREATDKAKEIGIIDDLNTLDAQTVAMIRRQLDLRYFTPIITRINDIKDRYGFSYFDVVTDKGACKFTIRNQGGSVIHLSETRLLISDLDGNRFEVPDTTKLTARELKKLDLFI